MSEKTTTEQLKEKLLFSTQNGGAVLSAEEIQAADNYAEDYKTFLDNAKTEGEAVKIAIELAKAHGFKPYDRTSTLKAGDKVYVDNRGKALILAVIGEKPLSEGTSIVAAHIDSPRLDLKPNPLYEESDFAYMDTHYYGGIKKYQWTAIPLALHGSVVKKDGTVIDINIGEKASDPVMCITDLLPHLGQEQMKRPASEFIKGEDLNILVGSRPLPDGEGSDLVKLRIMQLLHEKYDITEADFLSAELYAVPAFPARDVGLDRSMIGAYGHDDRVCAYPALTALFETEKPAYTAISVLADKEETGSSGNTGMQSTFLPNFIEDLAQAMGTEGRHVLSASKCLSADVNAAFDPLYPDVMVKSNSCQINRGVCITKYTGSRGKYDTSDASAEYMAYIRRLLDEKNVVWQIGELGKVDAGGGGTVAKFIAKLNVDTVDLGVPVLSMHAPYEVVSKIDVYMAHKAFAALFGR